MATFFIRASYDGGRSFVPCPVCGIFVDENDANQAAEFLNEWNPGIYEVVQRKRGRPVGTKDSKKRVRRTKAQINAGMVVDSPVDNSTDDDKNNVMLVDVDDAQEDHEYHEDHEDHEDHEYHEKPVEPTESQVDQMMRDIEHDRNGIPDSRAA